MNNPGYDNYHYPSYYYPSTAAPNITSYSYAETLTREQQVRIQLVLAYGKTFSMKLLKDFEDYILTGVVK